MAIDDELAQTAPAPGDQLAQTAADPVASRVRAALPGSLGRFRIESTLGEGGMGRVYLAFDPELERRIALKVLRHARGGDASARLLREARAMAKLSHPNVITVFDVGTFGGEDVVAMELIDGETLGAWVRRAKPAWREILAAFVAAGRGLAAAHAEGLVHRDFKPNNVLRSRAGQIKVTDFGLARTTAYGDEPEPSTASDAPSGPITRTATGAVLGTPAYMSPEQWTAGTVGPAADQFAFCVALWEALAGARPFQGDTLDALRAAVLAGPAKLDDSAVPRPLRALLRRGLAVDPAARWPSMDALLARLDGVARRRRWFVATVAGATISTLLTLVMAGRHGSGGDCSPALDPDRVWSPARLVALAAQDTDAATFVGGDVAAWRGLHWRACIAPPAVRSAQLACLDAVLARLDVMVGSALDHTLEIERDGLSGVLVDPTVCDHDPPPRLSTTTPELASALALLAATVIDERPPDSARIDALADHADSPCVRAIAITARIVREAQSEQALVERTVLYRDIAALPDIAARCEDDDIRAGVSLEQDAEHGDLSAAKAAVATFPSDDMRAELEKLEAQQAAKAQRWDEAWSHDERAIELFGRRAQTRMQVEVVAAEIQLLQRRGRPEDFARIEPLLARWVPRATKLGPRIVGELETHAAEARWHFGDVAGADAIFDRLLASGAVRDRPIPVKVPGIDMTGQVLDETGAAVADASVVSAFGVISDAVEVVTPLYRTAPRTTRTDHEGRFTITGARGWITAQRGTLRSAVIPVASTVQLVVHPTSRVEGTVDLGATPGTRVSVIARTTDKVPTMLIAPVLPDGRFTLPGVPRGAIAIHVSTTNAVESDFAPLAAGSPTITVGAEPVTGVALAVKRQRLHIIARSADLTRPEGALIWVFTKHVDLTHPTTLTLARQGVALNPIVATPVDPAQVPAELKGRITADDLLATVAERPLGDITLCATGFSQKQLAATDSLQDFGRAMAEMELACTQIPASHDVATVDLLPLRKLPTPRK